jgi:hydrogenase expression/formation protein HypC
MCLGIPGQIVAIENADRYLVIVDFAGVRRSVNVVCIVDDDNPIDGCVGQWVLVHVGFALNRVDPDEAAETLRILTEIGLLDAPSEATAETL